MAGYTVTMIHCTAVDLELHLMIPVCVLRVHENLVGNFGVALLALIFCRSFTTLSSMVCGFLYCVMLSMYSDHQAVSLS